MLISQNGDMTTALAPSPRSGRTGDGAADNGFLAAVATLDRDRRTIPAAGNGRESVTAAPADDQMEPDDIATPQEDSPAREAPAVADPLPEHGAPDVREAGLSPPDEVVHASRRVPGHEGGVPHAEAPSFPNAGQAGLTENEADAMAPRTADSGKADVSPAREGRLRSASGANGAPGPDHAPVSAPAGNRDTAGTSRQEAMPKPGESLPGTASPPAQTDRLPWPSIAAGEKPRGQPLPGTVPGFEPWPIMPSSFAAAPGKPLSPDGVHGAQPTPPRMVAPAEGMTIERNESAGQIRGTSAAPSPIAGFAGTVVNFPLDTAARPASARSVHAYPVARAEALGATSAVPPPPAQLQHSADPARIARTSSNVAAESRPATPVSVAGPAVTIPGNLPLAKRNTAPIDPEGPRSAAHARQEHAPPVPLPPAPLPLTSAGALSAWPALSVAGMSIHGDGPRESDAASDTTQHPAATSGLPAGHRATEALVSRPGPAATAATVFQQVAATIVERGNGRYEIALAPPELGRVEITLSDIDNRLSLSILAERPETLDLMRRHLGLLEQELRQFGLGSLSLQLGHEAGGQRRAARERASGAASGAGPDGIAGASDPARATRPPVAGGQLDLRL